MPRKKEKINLKDFFFSNRLNCSWLTSQKRLIFVTRARPGHFHCLSLSAVANRGKNWKCPDLGRDTKFWF